jgi:hypothetical protein
MPTQLRAKQWARWIRTLIAEAGAAVELACRIGIA